MKNRFTAFIFAFFLGAFGINNFYIGKTTRGIIDCIASVVFSWTVVAPCAVAIANIVRGCQYLWCNTDEEFVTKYCK